MNLKRQREGKTLAAVDDDVDQVICTQFAQARKRSGKSLLFVDLIFMLAQGINISDSPWSSGKMSFMHP